MVSVGLGLGCGISFLWSKSQCWSSYASTQRSRGVSDRESTRSLQVGRLFFKIAVTIACAHNRPTSMRSMSQSLCQSPPQFPRSLFSPSFSRGETILTKRKCCAASVLAYLPAVSLPPHIISSICFFYRDLFQCFDFSQKTTHF